MTDKDEWSLAADGGAAGHEPAGRAGQPAGPAGPAGQSVQAGSPGSGSPAVTPPTGAGQAYQPAGWQPEDPLLLSAGMGRVKRDGRWTVPPYLRLSPVAGSVVLDCLEAIAGADVITVSVAPGVGSVRVFLPAGWAANIDRLGSGIGSVTCKVPSTPAPGGPLVVFTGTAGAGSVRITGPTWWRRGPRS